VFHFNFATREWEQFGDTIYHDIDGYGERATLVNETCFPRDECKIFTLYDKLGPLVSRFKMPDGSKCFCLAYLYRHWCLAFITKDLLLLSVLAPSVFTLSVDGIALVTKRLDQAIEQIYIGESCKNCPVGTHALKVLVRSCVPFLWTLKEATAGLVLERDNAEDFDSPDGFNYTSDGTCQHLGLDVHTYWKETCIEIGTLDHDCFVFCCWCPP
jgi:hypothetical protein